MTVFVPYAYPTKVHTVSDSFHAHQSRTPPSVNPGTDYAVGYGSEVVSVADGYVVGIVVTNYGSGGRMIYVDHDDGTGVDYLHLSSVDVTVGERVLRGAHLGLSGASGFHNDRYYGPHLHISIRNKHGMHAENSGNYDFDATIRNQWDTAGWASDGGSTPIVSPPPVLIPLTKDVDMQLVHDKAAPGNAYLVAPGHKLVLVTDGGDQDLLRTVIQGAPDQQGFTLEQLNRLEAFMVRLTPGTP